jgi:hypothetical protein
MQNKLQAAGEVLGQVLDPSNLAQVTIVGGMIALGWSLSRLLRERFASDWCQELARTCRRGDVGHQPVRGHAAAAATADG